MLPYLLLSLNLLTFRQAPAGTRLHVRLTNAVGSYQSKAGMPVGAVLIAPVVINGEMLLPEGSTLAGTVTSVRRVGLGIRHETAALGLEFTQLTLPDGRTFPISVRLTQVDNSREHVTQGGGIQGVRTTGSLSYRVTGYLRTFLGWEVHATVALWAIKTLVVQVPEPEIYYPAGVELTLALTDPMLSNVRAASNGVARRLTDDERAEVECLLTETPYRASARSNRPSDLINVMLIGSREEISAAFTAAGWAESNLSVWSHIRGVQALAANHGYQFAPMSSLWLNESEPDMSWQKGLNDMAKRHHIRLWKHSETWNGKEIWMGAATRDVDFAYLRPTQAFTHKIEADVDLERDKIAHDLQFTSCVDVLDWWERPGVQRATHNATGDLMNTDARLAVVQLNACQAPRHYTGSDEPSQLRARGNIFHRFVRRQILSARNDLLRDNIYWRSYEGTRWIVTAIRHRKMGTAYSERPASTAVAMTPFSRDRIGWLW